MRLTKKVIDGFKYKGKESEKAVTRDVRWDTTIPGFGVRVYPTGKKTFILSYRANGRKKLMTIGRFGPKTLDEARDKAKSLLGKVADGFDPLQQRKKDRTGQTIATLAEAYISDHAKPHKKTWQTDQSRINKYILPTFGNLLIKMITQAEVVKWHKKIGSTKPYEANRNLALLSRMYSCAEDWGYVQKRHENPTEKVEKFKEEERDRWLKPQELPRLIKAIDEVENIYARACLWLYLLTGVRKSELLGSKWEDFDFNRNELRLPKTKSGKTHYVPLSGPAIKILKKLPQISGNPYTFPGARKGRPLVNIDKIWRKARKKAEVEDLRLHDLRRTVGSWMAQSGSSLHLIGKVLNHSHVKTTKVYARLAQDQAKEALDDHGKQIMKVIGKNQTNKKPKKAVMK